jgi:tetratricopeptide (TPR) repeat protein
MSEVTPLIGRADRLAREGDLRRAEELYRRVLAIDAGNTAALHALGRLCFRSGRAVEAVACYRRCVDREGANAACWFDLGAALATLGEMAEAEAAFSGSIAHNDENADAHFGLGVCQEALGRKTEAEGAYRAALAHKPAFVEALNNLGALLLALDRASEALPVLDQVLSLKADLLSARFNRGLGCFALGRYGEASAEFRLVLAAHPGQPDALNELGRCLLKQLKPKDAAALFRDGARRHPADPRFWGNLARALELCNDLTGAEDALTRALRLEPSSPALIYALASLEYRQGKLQQARQRLEHMLSMEDLSEEERSEASLELGLVLDDLGDAEGAFAALVEGKSLRLRFPAVRIAEGDRFLATVARARDWFTKERISRLSQRVSVDEGAVPAFFVGFPRSGTTLIEQALKAHPQIITTDERSPLEAVVRDLTSLDGYPEALETLTGEDLIRLRQRFNEAAEAAFGPLSGRLLFDKMPMNILHLGIVNCLFPEARVVVALRDPRDVCLSCFMQRFSLSGSMVNFLDLGRTAETYRAVMGLWLHYRAVISLPWHEIRYESLVEDFEGQLRALTEFLGLPWHADVLSFRDGAEQPAATTPSYRQVTRDTYKTSVGRWRRYQEQLGPVLPLLKPLVEAFGYGEPGR